MFGRGRRLWRPEGAPLRGRGSRERGGAEAAACAERDNDGAGAQAPSRTVLRVAGCRVCKERLDAFLDTVWARREDILVGGIGAYELYSGHESDSP